MLIHVCLTSKRQCDLAWRGDFSGQVADLLEPGASQSLIRAAANRRIELQHRNSFGPGHPPMDENPGSSCCTTPREHMDRWPTEGMEASCLPVESSRGAFVPGLACFSTGLLIGSGGLATRIPETSLLNFVQLIWGRVKPLECSDLTIGRSLQCAWLSANQGHVSTCRFGATIT